MRKTLLLVIAFCVMLLTGMTTVEAATTFDTLEWVKQNEDRVGNENGHPDGTLDGHFRLQLFLPQKMAVESISVRPANAAGTPVGNLMWHSQDKNAALVGVFYGNTRDQLNYGYVDSLGEFVGKTVFHIYINDMGAFTVGQYFLVDVKLANGQVLSKLEKQNRR